MSTVLERVRADLDALAHPDDGGRSVGIFKTDLAALIAVAEAAIAYNAAYGLHGTDGRELEHAISNITKAGDGE